MEGTRQTDQLIHEMRNILTEADTANNTTFNASKDEDDVPPVPSPSTSMQILREHLPPSSTTTSLDPSPYSSPISSPSTRLDQTLKTPIIHRVNFISPLSPAAKQMSETTQGSPGTAEFDCKVFPFTHFIDFADCLSVTLELDFSQAPCSTPLRSAKEVEKSILPPPSSFLRVLEGEPPIRSPSERPPHNRSQPASILEISFLRRPSNVLEKLTRERARPARQPHASRKPCPKILLRGAGATLSPGSVDAPQKPCIPLHPALRLSHPSTPEGT